MTPEQQELITLAAEASDRLKGLYDCRQEGTGKAIPFIPRPEQMEVFNHLLTEPLTPIYIIKSRRLGMSTALNTFQADCTLFRSGWRGVLIDQKQEDATRKMIEQIRFAVDSVGPEMLSAYRFDKRNDSQLRIRANYEDESKDSVIYATTTYRGADISMLHVSEWGKISATDEPRSNEILTGTWPAARMGIKAVETTWYGGKVGHLWKLINGVLTRNPNSRGKIFFFPWHSDPMAISTEGKATDEIEDYFRDLAGKLGKSFTQEQKKWYAIQRHEQDIFVRREFPSTLEEAFSAPIEGSIYGKQIDALRVAGGIIEFQPDYTALVHTAWDLGAPMNVICTYFQIVGTEIRVLDVDMDEDIILSQRVARIMGKGWPLGCHFLPHDAEAKNITGGSAKSEMEKLGLTNIKVVPRTHSIWDGINGLRQLFPRLVIRIPACDELIARLANYRVDEAKSKDEPVHDRNSHVADAMRQMGDAIRLGMVPGRDGLREKRNRQPVEVISGCGG